MLIRILKILLLLILLTFAHPLESQSNKNIALPAWFWNSPIIEKGVVTVGYSLPHQDSKHAFDDAFEDGALRLFADRESRIHGERGSASSPGGIMHMGSTLKQDVDTTGFAAFCQSIIRLDSSSTKTMRMILISTMDFNPDRSLKVLSIDNTSPSNDIDCTLGTAPIYFYESSSWIEAEYRARVELAVSTFSKFLGQRSSKDAEIFRASVTKTDAILRDVRTVKRSIDRENGIVKVWITGDARPNAGK